jgi:multidrug transporter EmrE-like cation transporter
VLVATVLALCAAVLHASWNLLVKQSEDHHLALWGQFTIAGVACGIGLVVWTLVDGAPNIAWPWAFVSGAMHVPYIVLLSRAYNRGDFSMSYPIVRGAGALAGALGGILILNDSPTAISMVGVVLVIFGVMLIARAGSWHVISAALAVSATIGIYTVVDAHGARESQPIGYSMALLVCAAFFATTWTLFTKRGHMISALKRNARTMSGAALASTIAYTLVLIAVRRAPVGYVAALRESSVVLAAFAGWKMLDEGDHWRRIASAIIVFVGLVVLVAGG